jgi:hypothetical protein
MRVRGQVLQCQPMHGFHHLKQRIITKIRLSFAGFLHADL